MRCVNLDGAARRFDLEIRRAWDEGARWGYFPVLYRAVTLTVGRAAEAGDFDDGERMERFVVDFANLYFEAVDAWRAGQATPPPWRAAFEAADRPGLLVLQHLLLGMNAHINRDLPISAAHVAPGASIEGLARDFHHINDILESLVDEAEEAVAAHTPGLTAVDRLAGRWDEALADFSMRRARASAWQSALALAPSTGADPRLVRRLDARAAELAGYLAAALPVPGARWWLEPHGGPREVIDTLLEIGDVPPPRAPTAPAAPVLASAPRPRWCDETLAPLRRRGDPSADTVVRRVLVEGQAGEVSRLLAGLSGNRDPVPAALPDPVEAWLAATGGLPRWADAERLARGQELMVRYGLQVLQSLLYRALPECYAMADGAALLHRAGRISALTHRRVFETMQFVMDVGAPGGLGPDGRGVRTAQRVRLLHAAIRVHVSDAGWPVDERGAPINQEDLLGTLMSFSVLSIDSLRRLGADLSAAEVDGWMHLWRVVGVLLGVEEAVLPRDLEDGLALMGEIRRRHHRASPEGRELMAALLAFMDALIPGEILDGLGPVMIRTLAGDRVAELLAVPPADWTRHFVGPYRLAVQVGDEAQDRSPRVAGWAGQVGEAFLRGLLDRGLRGRAAGFELPASLADRWR